MFIKSIVFLAVVLASSNLSAQIVSELRIGEASGQPGELVEVPVVASFSHPVSAFSIVFGWGGDSLSLLGWTAEGTASQGTDPTARFWRELRPGAGFIGLKDEVRESFELVPGEEVMIAKLQFRVLATAPAGNVPVIPLESVGLARTFLQVVARGTTMNGFPEKVLSGSVNVTVPSGPRPVDALTCGQMLDRVHLSFSPTEIYDSITVARDGNELAVLPGDATRYEDATIEGLGLQIYTVTARRDNTESYAVSCEIIVGPPTAPSVTDLTCSGGRLNWSNPMLFDHISIFRQGAHIADLDGSDEAYEDLELSSELTVYTVVTEFEGFRSPDSNCIDNGLWVVEIGDVHVTLDTTKVILPIYVTNPEPLNGVEVHLDIDQKRFRVIDTDQDLNFRDTVAHPETEFFASGISGSSERPALGIGFDILPPAEPEKYLGPGLRQRVINFLFEPIGKFQNGETFLVSLYRANLTDTNVPNSTVDANVLIGGEIRFGESVPPVEGLAAELGGDDSTRGGGGEGNASDFVGLSWRNGADYDAVRIERNGVPISEIAGNATTFVDTEVPAGLFTYKVVGVKNNETTFPRSAFLTTVSPPGAFLRGDTTRDGTINLADPMRTLQVLFRGGATFPCEDAADANDDGSLNLTDAVYTLHYLFRGNIIIKSPGTRYPWFDPTPDGLACRD